ncbi:hypothetical protein FND50_34825 [Rhodococcus sp. WB9]|nr:hypothetical protein FND50_34825 [Rhodococcus sp. WB9]
MWAPYGGATEEILIHFGMTTRRFIERLWQVVPESNCRQDEIRSLSSAYPRNRANERLLTRSVSPSAIRHVRGPGD